MRFWIQFEEEEWDGEVPVLYTAHSPDFARTTQGQTKEEAILMAQELLCIHLEDGPIEPIQEKPEGEGWEQVELPLEAQFALKVKWARTEAGLTMEQAAKRLGVSTGTYQRWESPRGNPTFKTAQKVLSALGKRIEMKVS